MSESNSNKPAKWFWVVSAVALIWNLMGVAAYIMHVRMTDSDIAALPEAERLLYETAPAWTTGAFALAVFGGTLGCIALLLRKSWAFPVLIVSLIGIVAQMTYDVFLSKAMDVYGPGFMIMPAMVLLIGIFLLFFARSSTAKGWLN